MASNMKTIHDSGNAHNIYNNNPVLLKTMVNKVIEVTRKDGESVTGTVFTIDPVSESIVLLRKIDETTTMDIVMGHAISSTRILPEEEMQPTVIDNLFSINKLSEQQTEKQLNERRKMLIEWLVKNRLPIKEDGDVLILHNALKIFPPYDANHCVSDNEIILDKVQKLVSAMPECS